MESATAGSVCGSNLRRGGTSSEASSQYPRDSVESRGASIKHDLMLQGLEPMEILVRYERSWNIQGSLDQHTALAEQRQVMLEVGANRIRAKRAQMSFAQLEVEDALAAVRSLGVYSATDASRVSRLATSTQKGVGNLRMATRLYGVEQDNVDKHIMQTEVEIEKSRLEMTAMKEAIDDKALIVAPEEPKEGQSKAPINDTRHLQRYSYCTNCRVGGHGQRFCEYFLERPTWRVYPSQLWFEDAKQSQYFCPLGKKLVDFADETHFSRIAMYLKGRAWLEEKIKVLEIAKDVMPETYIIEAGQWVGATPSVDPEAVHLPWFVKEADRNWGTSIHVCQKPEECLNVAKKDAIYAVQQHIKDPLLTDDGRKCHIKFYNLLICLEDAVTWQLYTYMDGYNCISPNPWSPDDHSKDTQVTIIRSERVSGWSFWPDAYPKCKAAVTQVIEKAVRQGKLEGRPGKKEFEICSADFVLDAHGKAWFLEFNMSPVLKDYHDSPDVNDAAMIRGALSIVVPWENGGPGLWDFAGEFKGEPPPPKDEAGTQPGEPSESMATSAAGVPASAP